ncbi:activator of (R)-2-hydroxyglutaryl-CoA dehydratase [candidate division KSB1 bacterium]|nr:activator of (R)-2-hydroxyglutaryl-CoA dehydratase [candidate division KSB1 bacterium]
MSPQGNGFKEIETSLYGTEPTITETDIAEKSVDEIIKEKLEERSRELTEEHLGGSPGQFFKPEERPFLKSERAHTTLLFGGLTWKHEKLIQASLQNLGYLCQPITNPDVRAFQIGKEYGNNGQCNPTYFTVGNLVQYLQELEKTGLTKKEITENYIFLTAGACGPCRFGMYEAEYRLALTNSGFGDFRVILFQQSGGLEQSDVEVGLELNLDFFLGLINALNMGDIINEVGFQIRPFEVNPGETDRVLAESMEFLYETLKSQPAFKLKESKWKFLDYIPGIKSKSDYIGKFLNQLYGESLVDAFKEVRDRFDKIPVDKTKVKPVVKITGEFWAQTTEGDGNFNMFKFLEKEGAQVLVEPIGTWIMYMIHQHKQSVKDHKGIKDIDVVPAWWDLKARWKIKKSYFMSIMNMNIAEKIFGREYDKLRNALGGTAHALIDQYELQRIAHPYYNSRAGGGEGHLEVAKNIYYMNKNIAHMVLSLKPFGCMPSTQSDGVQSAVNSKFKDMLYLPVETSGEGEINAHSRVQMTLGEARMKARKEFKDALDKTGYTVEQIQEFAAGHKDLSRPMYHVPETKGIVGTAANFVLHAADLMKGQNGRMN